MAITQRAVLTFRVMLDAANGRIRVVNADQANPKRKTVRWCILGILLVVVLGICSLKFLGLVGVQTQIAAIRQAGLPTSSLELDEWYKQPPTAENAALGVLEAVREHVADSAVLASPEFEFPKPGQSLPSEKEKALEDYLRKNAGTLEKLDEAVPLDGSRYPIDLSQGFNTLLFHLSGVKALSQLLRAEMVYRAHRGEFDRAVRSARNSLLLARTLRNEPVLVTELVRIACVSIALQGLEWLVNRDGLSDEHLRILGADLLEAETDCRDALFRGFAGERAGGISAFSLSGKQLATLGAAPKGSDLPNLGAVFQTGGFGLYRLFGFRDRDLEMYLELMDRFIAASTNKFPEALRKSREAEDEMVRKLNSGFGRFAILTRLLLPSLSSAVEKEARLTGRLRAARTSLALERHRLAHRRELPLNLEKLVPEFLPEVPLDPVHGKPLAYIRGKTAGYEIASSVPAPKRGPGTPALQAVENVSFIVLR